MTLGYVRWARDENMGEARALVTELEKLYVPPRWKIWRLLQRDAALRREQRLIARLDRCIARNEHLEELHAHYDERARMLALIEETPGVPLRGEL